MSKSELIEELSKMLIYDETEEITRNNIILAIELFPDIFERYNPFMHITSSVWIVNENFDKILLAYHKMYKSYSWIGGHNDGEVDCMQIALKETEEESGLKNCKVLSEDIFAVDILPVDAHIKNNKIVSTHLHLNLTYLLQANENEKLIVCPNENEDLKWFALSEYESHIEENRMVAIYRKLNNKVKEGLWQY